MNTDRRIVYLNPRDLLPSRQNVRSDPGDLAGLAETIREHGVLQPLGVTREGDAYRIVYGNRRREAAIVVGLDRVPCMTLDGVADEDVVVQQVLENLQRLDLNDLDKSVAFEQLLGRLTEKGMPQSEALDQMARTLGLSARQIQRYLRLRQLALDVQLLLSTGELGVTQAQHLVDIAPAVRQEVVARLAVEESLSAAELARLCEALQHNVNVDPHVALDTLRRGGAVPAVQAKPKEDVTPWGAPPERGETEGGAGRPAPERSAAAGGFESGAAHGSFEPATRDGNRVRKIHSLDSFMDELQRLTSCVQDGDFQGFLDEEGAAVKLRLAARQARFLADSLATIAEASGSAS